MSRALFTSCIRLFWEHAAPLAAGPELDDIAARDPIPEQALGEESAMNATLPRLFGYRYLSVQVGDSDHHVDITMNGPMVGYGFTF